MNVKMGSSSPNSGEHKKCLSCHHLDVVSSLNSKLHPTPNCFWDGLTQVLLHQNFSTCVWQSCESIYVSWKSRDGFLKGRVEISQDTLTGKEREVPYNIEKNNCRYKRGRFWKNPEMASNNHARWSYQNFLGKISIVPEPELKGIWGQFPKTFHHRFWR